MTTVRPWLVTMFDKERHKELFLMLSESAITALQDAAHTLKQAVARYEPCEVHVQLLTTEEYRQIEQVHRPHVMLPQAAARKP